MSSSMLAIVFTFFLALLVNAELYVVDPQSGSACTGGQPCTVTWLEDGSAPLLPSIGLASVGLYTGQQQLIQALEPVDVSTVRAFTFTPNPAAGPNSGAYYIGFVSANPVDGSQIYRAYSPWFRLEGMTGSFESPLPSATVPISISIPPSGSASARPTTSLSTITVGTLSSAEPIPTPGASSSSEASASSSLETSSGSGSSTSASEAPSSSAAPSSSGFVTSRTPAPTTSRASTTSEDTASASETPDDGSSACSTPVSNRVAIFVTLVGALAFFL